MWLCSFTNNILQIFAVILSIIRFSSKRAKSGERGARPRAVLIIQAEQRRGGDGDVPDRLECGMVGGRAGAISIHDIRLNQDVLER